MKIELCSLKIFDGCFKAVRVFFEQSKSGITTVAQKTPCLSGGVTVINVEPGFKPTIPIPLLIRLFAYGAHAVLGCKHLLIFLARHSVFVLYPRPLEVLKLGAWPRPPLLSKLGGSPFLRQHFPVLSGKRYGPLSVFLRVGPIKFVLSGQYSGTVDSVSGVSLFFCPRHG